MGDVMPRSWLLIVIGWEAAWRRGTTTSAQPPQARQHHPLSRRRTSQQPRQPTMRVKMARTSVSRMVQEERARRQQTIRWAMCVRAHRDIAAQTVMLSLIVTLMLI